MSTIVTPRDTAAESELSQNRVSQEKSSGGVVPLDPNLELDLPLLTLRSVQFDSIRGCFIKMHVLLDA